jgi:hypothetical protein
MREVAHRVAQGVDIFTELEIQAGQVHGGVSSGVSGRGAAGSG